MNLLQLKNFSLINMSPLEWESFEIFVKIQEKIYLVADKKSYH